MSADLHDEAFSLTSLSDLAILPIVRALVQAAGRQAGLDKDACYEAVVAANEACSNVIRHAHGGQRSKRITVICRIRDDGLEVVMRDEGPPFDLATVPDLDPAEIRAGGRGVYLIRHLMDDVTSTPRAEGGNEMRMRKRARAEV
jgi:serine/threonine-protein kinase RsbW